MPTKTICKAFRGYGEDDINNWMLELEEEGYSFSGITATGDNILVFMSIGTTIKETPYVFERRDD